MSYKKLDLWSLPLEIGFEIQSKASFFKEEKAGPWRLLSPPAVEAEIRELFSSLHRRAAENTQRIRRDKDKQSFLVPDVPRKPAYQRIPWHRYQQPQARLYLRYRLRQY